MYPLKLVFSFVILIVVLSGCHITNEALNEKKGLAFHIVCELDSKDFSGVTAKLLRDGDSVSEIRDQEKFKFMLEFNTTYKLLIFKPGYEKINVYINTTNITIKRWNKGFPPFNMIATLKLLEPTKKPDRMKVKRDALIVYHVEADDFDFTK